MLMNTSTTWSGTVRHFQSLVKNVATAPAPVKLKNQNLVPYVVNPLVNVRKNHLSHVLYVGSGPASVRSVSRSG